MSNTRGSKNILKRKNVTFRLRPEFVSYLKRKSIQERVSQGLVIEMALAMSRDKITFPIKRVSSPRITV